MENCKVSVIVPVYNAEIFIHRCVDSLVNQTLRDIEIILVDDGSKDSSPAICDEYAEKYDNIIVLHLENGGPARARNKGIEIAQGEYLAFCDSDDYVDLNMYQKLFDNAKKNDSDIAMCCLAYDYGTRIETKKFIYNEYYKNHEEVKSILKRIYECDFDGIAGPTNKLYRTAMVNQNNVVFDESMIRGEDFWFNFGCLKVAESLSFIEDCLYYYYQNESSIMHDPKNDSYDHWVENRKRLLKENESFGFEIDNNKFYKDFIYKTIMFCRDKVKLNQNEIVKSVFGNEFFKATVKYNTYLPKHIKLISFFIKMNLNGLAMLLLKIW